MEKHGKVNWWKGKIIIIKKKRNRLMKNISLEINCQSAEDNDQK